MYKDVLRAFAENGYYPVVTMTILVVFFLIFSGMLVWVLRIRKGHTAHMAALPLEDGSQSPTVSGEVHHG
ncbi:cbb3-type cytochrome c oxidase subunit 3 [Kiritimatiellaeota bacterium B1221]|nr:cbb3-type cytochrome c oxidase subunit 3 [Kiritimatiellaeota bacterium B1221]